jgi:ribosomal protein L37AE/L43A
VGNSSEYLRGLLLPEISAVKQAATLITPRLPFQSGSRISMLHDGREDQGQLSRRVSATGSISQFELKLQNRSKPETSSQKPVPCPFCFSPLVRRKSKKGWFWGCSSFPACRQTVNDIDGKPDLPTKPAT